MTTEAYERKIMRIKCRIQQLIVTTAVEHKALVESIIFS